MFYENYLNSIKPDMSFIPESASFNDMAVFTNRAIQDVYNEAAITITSQEIAIFESVMLEADGEGEVSTEKKKGLLKTIGDFFGWLWGKMKAFYAKIKEAIGTALNNAKLKMGKGIDKNFTNALNSKDPAMDKLEFVAVDFDYIGKIGAKVVAAYDNIEALTDKQITRTDLTGDNKKEVNKSFADLIKGNVKEIAELEKESKKEIKETSQKVDISEIRRNKNEIIDIVFGGSEWINVISKCYDKNKKAIDSAMKAFKDQIKDTKDKTQIAIIKTRLNNVKEENKYFAKVASMYNTILKKIRVNYISIVAKVCVRAGVKLTKEDVDITINTDTDADDKVEVKDELEEAFASFIKEEDEVEVDDIEATADDSDGEEIEVDDKIEESTLYRAIVAYLD